MKHPLARGLAALALIACAGFTQAQDYPNHPLRVIVPFPPGGGGDVLMRPFGKKLTELLGQPIIIDNRGGANGNIGAEAVAKAVPDGYTFLLANNSLPISATLYTKLNFDPLKHFIPVGLVADTPSALVVHPSVPVRNVSELLALARTKPGSLNFGSAGTGSTPHLAIELLKKEAGVEMVHVPYKGSGPAVAAVLAGDVQVLVSNVGTVLAQIRADKLRAIAVTSARRAAVLPDVPTVGETVKGYESRTWYALFAPAGTPPAAINKISGAIATAMKAPDVNKQLVEMGYEPKPNTPAQMATLYHEDIATWAKVIKLSGAKAE
ncbi:MAG TPA: tripartite tricarboxylate transporter substrate binding protein [Burkholderiales bacterium]